jgi:ATP-binding cassette, subfamily B, bacterial PglK
MLKYLAKVSYVLTGKRKSLVLLFFMFALTSALEVLGIGTIGPFLHFASAPESLHKVAVFNWIYQQFDLQSSEQIIPLLGLFIVGVFCVKSLLYFLAKSYIFYFSFHQQKLLTTRLFNTYSRISYTFHLNRNTSTIIKNILSETHQFTQNCLLPLLNATSNAFVVVFLVALLAQNDLFLLATISIVILPIFLLFQRLGGKFKKWGQIKSQAQSKIIQIINHGLGGLKETRVIGCESYFEEKLAQQARDYARAATLFNSSHLLPRILIETIVIIFLIGFISLSQIFSDKSLQDLTSVMGVFAVASIRLVPSVSQFIQALGQLKNASYTLDMLYSDLKEIEKQGLNPRLQPSSKKNYPMNERAMTFSDRVDLINVTYRYPGTSEPAIRQISLSLKKGQSIAFIGKSGSGKTTLVDVILGLLEPEGGDIQVDGTSIYHNLRSWQNLIGYIPQSIFLIDDTIERNIAFGVPDASIDPEKLARVIKAAQLEELVAQLPQGIKTEVGERGVRLSGGQCQRIGIARALYHEREILVLDEATSSLDNETERLVNQAIQSLAGTKTLIVVAHRLSTIEQCDRVYVLENGCVIQSGHYQEVL